MHLKRICDPKTNVQWTVRLVQTGERYGRLDCCVHDQPESMVEFFDTRFPDTPIGYFVSRYFVSTFLNPNRSPGVLLDTGNSGWSLSEPAFREVEAWLKEVCPLAEPA